jgi:hypothetical protein
VFCQQIFLKLLWVIPIEKCLYSSADEWANAAGRPDLCKKTINAIIKYTLCADHFSDDCFHDPEHKTRLKKRMVNKVHAWVPLPTIFQDNFEECAKETSKILRKASESTDQVILEQSYTLAQNTKDSTDAEAANDVHGEIVEDEVSMVQVEILDEPYDCSTVVVNICRLCIECYSEDTSMVDIFSTPSLANGVELLLPGMVCCEKRQVKKYFLTIVFYFR